MVRRVLPTPHTRITYKPADLLMHMEEEWLWQLSMLEPVDFKPENTMPLEELSQDTLSSNFKEVCAVLCHSESQTPEQYFLGPESHMLGSRA